MGDAMDIESPQGSQPRRVEETSVEMYVGLLLNPSNDPVEVDRSQMPIRPSDSDAEADVKVGVGRLVLLLRVSSREQVIQSDGVLPCLALPCLAPPCLAPPFPVLSCPVSSSRLVSTGCLPCLALSTERVVRILPLYPSILDTLLRTFRNSRSLIALVENAPDKDDDGHDYTRLNVLRTIFRLIDVRPGCSSPKELTHMWEWTPLLKILKSPSHRQRFYAGSALCKPTRRSLISKHRSKDTLQDFEDDRTRS
eukprot:768699-Hanusia_phi.AAC.9